MSNVLYGGKILISENGSPKMDKKIKGDSTHHHPDTGNILEDKEEKTEISAEYAEEHQEDEEDGEDDEEATEGLFHMILQTTYSVIQVLK